jgi:hypothetical protein
VLAALSPLAPDAPIAAPLPAALAPDEAAKSFARMLVVLPAAPVLVLPPELAFALIPALLEEALPGWLWLAAGLTVGACGPACPAACSLLG